ncbi:MAG: hypothetical protein ACRDU4_20150 [Mycobacterium sp.]
MSPSEIPPKVCSADRSAFQAAFTAGAYVALKLFAGWSFPAIPALLSKTICNADQALQKSVWAVQKVFAAVATSCGVTLMLPLEPKPPLGLGAMIIDARPPALHRTSQSASRWHRLVDVDLRDHRALIYPTFVGSRPPRRGSCPERCP